jgi:predicted outer membrane repeat protein
MPTRPVTCAHIGPRALLMSVLLGGLAALGWASPVLAAIGPVCRCTTTGTSGADGSTWAMAMNLQTALGSSPCTEVWVAHGSYTPTVAASPTLGDRYVSFSVHPGVAVYGGFAGTESQRDQRDFVANPTILSGNIGDQVESYDNSFNVVTMDGTSGAGTITASTVLDGFTIRGGFASMGFTRGAGLDCYGFGSGSECSPTLANLVFSSNYSGNNGGAMYCEGQNGGKCSPTLSNVIFSANTTSSSGKGGAMYNDGSNNGTSSPTLSNVTFSANATGNTGDGGAMYNDGRSGGNSSPSLSNVTFSNNSAAYNGGAMNNDGSGSGTSSPILRKVTFSGNTVGFQGQGGAMFNEGSYNGTSSPILGNVTFSANSTGNQGSGGAIYNRGTSGGVSSPRLTNVTFSGNHAYNYGGAMENDGGYDTTLGTSAPVLVNVIAWNDTANIVAEIDNYWQATTTIANSAIAGGCPANSTCTNMVAGNPQLGPLADNGGSTQTMAPPFGSPTMDAGSDADCNLPPVDGVDQRGYSRAQQGTHCDIGAVEFIDTIFRNGFDQN